MHQALEHVVEQTDLFVRIVHRAIDEKIGHPAKGFDAARDGSMRERGLQFVEQTFGSSGGLRTHDSILEHSDLQIGDGFSVSGK
jgi:hypothetical protein